MENREVRERSGTTLIISGVLALIFGIIAVAAPAATVGALVLLWGIYALVDGVMYLIAAFRDGATGSTKWLLIIGGIVGIAAGLIAIFKPFSSAVVLTVVLGLWLVIHGVMNIWSAFRANRDSSRWVLVLSGVLWIIAGALLFGKPGAGALALALWLGILAIAWGIALIVGGIMMRKRAKERAAA